MIEREWGGRCVPVCWLGGGKDESFTRCGVGRDEGGRWKRGARAEFARRVPPAMGATLATDDERVEISDGWSG